MTETVTERLQELINDLTEHLEVLSGECEEAKDYADSARDEAGNAESYACDARNSAEMAQDKADDAVRSVVACDELMDGIQEELAKIGGGESSLSVPAQIAKYKKHVWKYHQAGAGNTAIAQKLKIPEVLVKLCITHAQSDAEKAA